MKLLMTASQIRVDCRSSRSEGGEDIAEVRDVTYDPEAGRLFGVSLNQRGFLAGRRPRGPDAAGQTAPARSCSQTIGGAAIKRKAAALAVQLDAPDDTFNSVYRRSPA